MHRNSWRDLAIWGSEPLFGQPLHVNKPNAVNRARLLELIDGMLDRRWFSDGVLVKEFEDHVARLTHTRHCVSTCNGTMGLELVFRALGIAGEVIVPSFTFVATVQALRCLNIRPIFCDVDRATHNVDPDQVRRLITPNTTAVLGVHLWGQPCDIAALTEIANEHRLALVFDAAHALGSTYHDRPIGGFGSAEVFSFHATKFVNSAEGGAITTDDERLAAKLRAVRDFGFDANDQVIALGTNGKMAELCAAMGITYLEGFEQLWAATRAVYGQYRTQLSGIPGISLLNPEQTGMSNCQYIVSVVDEDATGLSRDELLQVLRAEGILAKRYFYPGCHRMMTGGDPVSLPVTEELIQSVLVLPGGAAVSREEVRGVCQVLRVACQNGAEVRKGLAAGLRRP